MPRDMALKAPPYTDIQVGNIHINIPGRYTATDIFFIGRTYLLIYKTVK